MPLPRSVLPPASTALERALDTGLPRQWGALADTAEPAATSAHAALLPWAAQHWQLAQLAPYFEGVQALIDQARPWLMERGSAASLRRAMGWLGFAAGVAIDEDGAWLHIDAGQPLLPAQIARLAQVVRASLPAHVHFWRVFHGLDLRPIVTDRGPALDGGMLDGYSGVMGASDLVESFAVLRAATAPTLLQAAPSGLQRQLRVSVARYDDMPLLDAWHLDSSVLAAVASGVMEIRTSASNAPALAGLLLLARCTRAGVAARAGQPPAGFAFAVAVAQGAVPMHAPRRWGGPWGGPWRGQLKIFRT